MGAGLPAMQAPQSRAPASPVIAGKPAPTGSAQLARACGGRLAPLITRRRRCTAPASPHSPPGSPRHPASCPAVAAPVAHAG
ncbi:hypothetical protein EJA05_07845 [Pseudomonas oryziphila]|uniref:Uncharacterized protein n=1 Tax=Pseudomonas entomophila TaxID=312306 RepID=A0A3Q8TZJ8_9PSED|nr:hypothetical protein EJA05_07845 [Pseudomonas oryziphila]